MKSLIVLFVIFSCQTLLAQTQNDFPPPGYPALMQCVYSTYQGVKLPADIEECSDTFNTVCLVEKGGVIVKENDGLSPVSKKFCFAKSFDAGAPCNDDGDCMVGCDFEYAIKKNCSLIKEIKQESENISEEVYECNDNPGICLPAPVYKPMNGKTIKYKIDGIKLIKTIIPGPIS